MESAAIAPLRGKQFSEADASILKLIIARNPDATRNKLRDLFESQTGRRPSAETVWRYRKKLQGKQLVRRQRGKGYQVQMETRSDWFPELNGKERLIILKLMDENPNSDAIEIVSMLADLISGGNHA